jgi:hypothetical protein
VVDRIKHIFVDFEAIFIHKISTTLILYTLKESTIIYIFSSSNVVQGEAGRAA